MIQITNLSKSYGKNKALDNISLDLLCGIYALLGPNGAGKSTLMNILTLGLSPDSGEVSWQGRSIEKAGRDYRAILGYMPQQQGIYDGFRGIDFLYYIAGLKGLKKTHIQTEVLRVAALVNLSERLNDRLPTYSGGMKQRILLAAAVLGDPKLVILDEPTAGLDPKERVRVREIIKNMAGDKIIISATHVVSDIETIADEIILLKNGVIADMGSPAELCDKLNASEGLESVYMKIFGEE
ncbi:MAG: ATP-binding cassette domain-containing protein [Oscillospiraceae bacterium]|nr:ATP-binding cassette domain-containing protein [Oscillospiraceae bacterium]